jgi:hypothetical protein
MISRTRERELTRAIELSVRISHVLQYKRRTVLRSNHATERLNINNTRDFGIKKRTSMGKECVRNNEEEEIL